MRNYALTLVALLLMSVGARAVELMKWERIPLQIPLTVGQERIVFVDKNVRVGFPPTLNDKLRVQSSGGAVYLDARQAFPVTRLQLQDKENGEIILLDVSATVGKTAQEPVKIVYEGVVASATSTTAQQVSRGGDSAGRTTATEEKSSRRKAAKLTAPLPVVLTRYAAQSLYGPLRTVEAVAGISPVSLKLPTRITTLLPSEQVIVMPLAAWSLQGNTVVALQIRNRSADNIIMDPRALRGQFLTATFQHRWLGRAGTPEDTTVLYLVTEGRPEAAFIAETVSPQVKPHTGQRAAK